MSAWKPINAVRVYRRRAAQKTIGKRLRSGDDNQFEPELPDIAESILQPDEISRCGTEKRMMQTKNVTPEGQMDTRQELKTEDSVRRPESAEETILPKKEIDGGKNTDYLENVIREGRANRIQVSSVMICGNVSLLSDAAIDKAARTCHVVVAGEGRSHGRGKNRYFETSPGDEKFKQLFDAFDIDVVWYLSGYADGQNGMDKELKNLECIIETSARNGVSKLVVVSSVESVNFHWQYDVTGRVTGRSYGSARSFQAAQMEEFAGVYAKSHGLKTIILRAPYLAAGGNVPNFLNKIFEKTLTDHHLLFPYSPENKVDFLSDGDLMDLLLDVSEEGADQTAVYHVSSGYHYTWGDLEKTLCSLDPQTKVEYENKENFICVQTNHLELKRQYGFIPMDNVLAALPSAYEEYKQNVHKDSPVKQLLRKLRDGYTHNVVGYLELVLLFLLTEYLVQRTQTVVFFKYVDLRLFYVLILGTTHGVAMGVLAGILSGIALFFQFGQLGINATMLFYNLENWLPFVVYLITGSVTGYISSVRRQENTFLKKEFDILREKFLFLNDVYKGAVKNKGAYKRQILGYKDSFGVIFQAVQKLDSVLPQEIFMNGIQIMEDILQNHSIAIFTVDDWQKYGRLAACSGELLQDLPKSIVLSVFEPLFSTVKQGRVWKNTGFREGMPMYAYGICSKDRVDLLIFVYDAGPEQMGLYYVNLFQILCNLIQLSFARALEYQRAIEQEKYYPDTLVLIPGYFAELLHAQRQLMDAGLANYCLIRFVSRDKQYISDALRGRIRNSDMIGADDGGTLYMILTQSNPKTLKIVEERLNQVGLEFEIVNGSGAL